MTTNGGPAVLFRNEGVTNHSLRIKLVGTHSNRDGIGTARDRECRRRKTVADVAQRLRVPFGERARADLRTGTAPAGGRHRAALAERPESITCRRSRRVRRSRSAKAKGSSSSGRTVRRKLTRPPQRRPQTTRVRDEAGHTAVGRRIAGPASRIEDLTSGTCQRIHWPDRAPQSSPECACRL